MKVLFHTNTLNYRGTTVAVTDYAKYNQEILGNESVIAFKHNLGYEKDMGSELAVIDELKKQFNVIGYYDGDLEGVIEKEKINLAYFIRAGDVEPVPKNVKSAVHAVFQFNEPHGDRYAYVSEWLSNTMSGGKIPHVPHIVNLPDPTKNFRQSLGIKEDQIVIGRLGGYFTFDIKEVKEFIKELVEKNSNYVFLFAGTEPFVDHPNVKFINEIHSLQKKSNFINTCDAMLHARMRGETFGLSIAEFLFFNKPVMAWSGGHDKNHTQMLKDTGLLYNNINDLFNLISNVKDYNRPLQDLVVGFKPEAVMKRFKEVFYD